MGSVSDKPSPVGLYDWQRFWITRTGTLDLSDGGFFVDPTNAFRSSDPLRPATLTELAKYRALVLLGEPGIGKSTALEAEAKRVSGASDTEETVSIHVDLRAYSSDMLLHQKVFESVEFIAWTKAASHLILHLDSLSDQVSLFLKRELVDRGVVANREVEVGRVPGAPIGKRTDIRVDAIRRSEDGFSYDTITAVIETKGCWNGALFSSMRNQLFDEYMVRLQAPVGIYLVGWFDKIKWDPDDRRRAASPDSTLSEIQRQLDIQADAIPPGFLVHAVVLDCHAP